MMVAADMAEGRTPDGTPAQRDMVEAAVMYGDATGTEWLDMPAGIAYRMRVLHNVHAAMRGYIDAAAQTQTVEWTRRRPRQWDLVSSIIAERKRKKRTDG